MRIPYVISCHGRVRPRVQHGCAPELGKALQTYSSTNDIRGLIETVRALYQHQGEFSSNGSGDKKPVRSIKRADLKFVCYEYIYA
jgi:hypothetical protein